MKSASTPQGHPDNLNAFGMDYCQFSEYISSIFYETYTFSDISKILQVTFLNPSIILLSCLS